MRASPFTTAGSYANISWKLFSYGSKFRTSQLIHIVILMTKVLFQCVYCVSDFLSSNETFSLKQMKCSQLVCLIPSINSLICHIFVQTNIINRLQEIFRIICHWFKILNTVEMKKCLFRARVYNIVFNNKYNSQNAR